MNISIKKYLLLTLSIPVSFFLTSCSPPNEKAHPTFIQAEKAFKDQKYQEAADSYQEYLDFNRKSKITHYKLASLYGDYLDDPFLSAYHYRQFLIYEPDSPDKEAIQAWITAAEKKFADKMLEKYPNHFSSISELKKLKERQQKLIIAAKKVKANNAALLKELKGGTKLVSGTGNDQVVADGIQEVYTVQPGDYLQKISRQFYGTSKYDKLIFEANKNILKSESQLAVGQKLQIPKLKKVFKKTPPRKKRKKKKQLESTTELIIDYPTE